MKKFLLFILKISIVLVVVAVALDFGFTTIYKQSKSRGKIDYVFNSSARKYDVVILGSSRANNHFVSDLFEKQGLKTFNYGMSGGHLFEASLLLKLMIERKYQIKNVILEADLNLSNDQQSEGVSAKYLPYLHSSETVRKHFENEQDFNELYYIPFYRYLKFETKIGFRDMFKVATNEKTSILNHKGYYSLGKTKGNMKNNITKLKPLAKNKYYEEIKALCKANNINFIAVMTPMCENVTGMNYFEKVHKAYPEIHNYENAVVENKYFSSCGHMNDEGARLFTNSIIHDFFKSKK
ncbi:hypothetical protein H8R23_08375 [Flavobacterium sp. F-380]|uniref:SGNH/GDSL hydrolase family protein n=1 Tax=Flavobacterium kayseriense TaxID=2764714 RepID=A0ABR7J7V5_9FLAO|nr:hypothetical protein [Flavobacterium kayseriense]MBC5841419.1 hypothetical protein [Flavobacterium kayseriense]MBC5847947.1 hypothetical protein [Flavobacterium kayseriense]